LQARLQLTLAGLYSEIDEPERMRAVLDSARKATDAAGPEGAGLRALADCMRASDLVITPDQDVAEAAFAIALPVLRSGPQADPNLAAVVPEFPRCAHVPGRACPRTPPNSIARRCRCWARRGPASVRCRLRCAWALAWNAARMGDLGPASRPARRAAGVRADGAWPHRRSGQQLAQQPGHPRSPGRAAAGGRGFVRARAGDAGPEAVPSSRSNLAQHQFMVGRTKEAVENNERSREHGPRQRRPACVAIADAAYVGCPAASAAPPAASVARIPAVCWKG
jgi:hypothetical protein